MKGDRRVCPVGSPPLCLGFLIKALGSTARQCPDRFLDARREGGRGACGGVVRSPTQPGTAQWPRESLCVGRSGR